MLVVCRHCEKRTEKAASAVNRANRQGAPLFCSRTCCGASRRVERADDERKALKAAYDRQRRAAIGEVLRAKKRAAYHAAVANNPEVIRAKEREHRAKRMPQHVEYCRRPEYRARKREYDRQRCAQQDFGPFAEAALILRDLEAEISTRATRYEIYSANGTLNKALRRKREYAKAFGC